ncbi:DUF6660 family protein [Aurantibacter sp.]|uniref:DUF6660 family protein n=1 Tax=Aurantibacter sp. TaxID=2807103 RepID=UPI0032651F90
MKYISFLLAIYILALAIRPCCEDSNCTEDDSYQTTQVTDNHFNQDNDENKEHKGICSPFYACGNCVGFTFTTVNFSLTPDEVLSTNLVSIYNPSFFSEFHIAIWQPPKIG